MLNDKLDFIEFSAKKYNAILVGGKCVNCKFCSLKQCGPALKTTCQNEYISIEKFISLVNLLDKGELIKLDNVPLLASHPLEDTIMTFYSKEFFSHPDYPKLLEILNQQTNSTKKTICTTMIPEEKYFDLINEDYGFWLSINTLDKEERLKLMNFDIKKCDETIEKLDKFVDRFKKQLLEISLVYTGNLSTIKKSLEYLAKRIDPKTLINILCLTTTKYTLNKEIIAMSEKAHDTYEQVISLAYKIFKGLPNKIESSSLHNPWELEEAKNKFDDQMKSVFEKIRDKKINSSEIAFVGVPHMKKIYEEKYSNLNWIYVKNEYFGEQVYAYNLLPVRDILNKTKDLTFKYYAVSKALIWTHPERDFLGDRIPDNFILG
jgi:hypothetical protein